MDKAGAYGIQNAQFQPTEQIAGCYLNVVGLLLCTLVDLLAEFGVQPAIDMSTQEIRRDRSRHSHYGRETRLAIFCMDCIIQAQGGADMTLIRSFVSYAAEDINFAMQLMTDLRNAGVEVITDQKDLHGTAFEQFLLEELPRCQQLIVVQTSEALKSPRVNATV